MRSSKSGRVLRISIRVYLTKGRGRYQQLAWKEEKCQRTEQAWGMGGMEVSNIWRPRTSRHRHSP